MSTSKKYDLEDRFVKFAGETILFCNKLPNDRAGITLCDQLTRSSTSAALNFGEAQGAYSTKDMIFRLSISLKELKESRVAFKIINYIEYSNLDTTKFQKECEELIAIVASIIKNKRTNKL